MGVVIVATANRAPWDWNRQGIHEELFQHFVVGKLLHAAQPFELSCACDYRRALSEGHKVHSPVKGIRSWPFEECACCLAAACIISLPQS